MMNEETNSIDLTKILKNVPKGTKLYSPLFGEVKFNRIDNDTFPIVVNTHGGYASFSKTGIYFEIERYPDAECLLFPSKDNHDWNTFKIDLPIDTPVMVSDFKMYWELRYYAGNKLVFPIGAKSKDKADKLPYIYIIPFDKFNPNNIEESLKYSL